METRKWIKALLLATVLIQARIHAQTAGFTFEVQLHDYRNPFNRLAGGGCCGGDRTCRNGNLGNECEHTEFTFCLTAPGFPAFDDTTCPFGEQDADDSVFEDSDGSLNGQDNGPTILDFEADAEWPEEFQLRIAIGDTGEGSSNEVDTIVIQRNDISPSETFTAMENFLGVHGNAIMELSFRLTCKGNFYGTDCATFCEQTDHDTLGHFSCDENGNRVCLDGYTDPTTNCVTMSCDSECAEDLCADPQPCMNGGVCVTQNTEYICECAEGYEGTNCESVLETPAVSTEAIPPSDTPPTMNDDIRQRPTPSQSDSTSPPTQAATSSHTTSTNPQSDVATSTDDEPASEMQNSTDISGVSGQSSAAAERVAGSLVAVLTVIAALSVLGVSVGIVVWRHRRNKKNKECPRKNAVGNPMYNAVHVEPGFRRKSNIPVKSYGKDVEQAFGAPSTSNGCSAPADTTYNKDSTDPIYENQHRAQTENLPTVHKPITLPPSPAAIQCKSSPVSGKKFDIYTRPEHTTPQAALSPPPNEPPPPPPPPLRQTKSQQAVLASPRLTKAITVVSPKMNPYASYGDETMLRVAIENQAPSVGNKPGALFDAPDYDEPVLERPTRVLFDNADYAAPTAATPQESIFDNPAYA